MSSPSQIMLKPFLLWPSESHTQKPGSFNPLLVNTALPSLGENQGHSPGKITGISAETEELDQHQGDLIMSCPDTEMWLLTQGSSESRAWDGWPAGGGHMATAMGRKRVRGRGK